MALNRLFGTKLAEKKVSTFLQQRRPSDLNESELREFVSFLSTQLNVTIDADQLSSMTLQQIALLAVSQKKISRSVSRVGLYRSISGSLAKVLPGSNVFEVDPDGPFLSLGLSSHDLVELAAVVSQQEGMDIEATFFFEFGTIKSAATELLRRAQRQPGVPLGWEPSAFEGDDIVIIGLSMMLPHCSTLLDVAKVFTLHRDCISEVPLSRWDWKLLESEAAKWGGFCEHVDEFDGKAFNISAAECKVMDPQHRLFLQESVACVESSGKSFPELRGESVGVYAGVSKNDYAELMRENRSEFSSFITTGTVHSILSNRVSFLLDFHGPSISLDTACSSSLVVCQLAFRDLQANRCSAALFGGVNALLSPTMYKSHLLAGFLSPSGRCATFDSSADGYVRSEGCAVMMLEARSSHEECLNYGMILGAAIQHGGTSAGLTAPSSTSQSRTIEEAYNDAKVSKNDVIVHECHGSGTPLGDPIETRALNAALGAERRKNFLLTATKPNFGHLESAAGMVGLMKLMSLNVCFKIDPQNHFSNLNPKISLADRFIIPVESVLLQGHEEIVCSICSFGMGGVSASVLVQVSPPSSTRVKPPRLSANSSYFFPVSSGLSTKLKEYCSDLQTFLVCFDSSLSEMAHHLQRQWPCSNRMYFASTSRKHLISALGAGKSHSNHEIGDSFLSGQKIPFEEQTRSELLFLRRPLGHSRVWFQKVLAPSEQFSQILVESKFSVIFSETDDLLSHSVILQQKVLPAAVFLDLVQSAVLVAFPGKDFGVERVCWSSPAVPRDGFVSLAIQISKNSVEISDSRTNFILFSAKTLASRRAVRFDIPSSTLLDVPKSKQVLYDELAHNGFSYGTSLQSISFVKGNSNSMQATADCSHIRSWSKYSLHPSAIDAAFQVVHLHRILFHSSSSPSSSTNPLLPSNLDAFFIHGEIRPQFRVTVVRVANESSCHYNMELQNLDGSLAASFFGLSCLPKFSFPEHQQIFQNTTNYPLRFGQHDQETPVEEEASAAERAFFEAIVHVLDISPEELTLETDLKKLGINSLIISQLSSKIEELLGRQVSRTLFFEFSTLREIFASAHFHERKSKKANFQKQNKTASPHFAIKVDAAEAVLSKKITVPTGGNRMWMRGASCKVSSSVSLRELWQEILMREDLVSSFPSNRSRILDPKAALDCACYITNPFDFDALFFNISPKESRVMDPQHRFALECSIRCLDDANVDFPSISGSDTSVFIGIGKSEYASLISLLGIGSAHSETGLWSSGCSGRVSYFLNIHGPSVSIDTACSSSIVALSLCVAELTSHPGFSLCGGVNFLASSQTTANFRAAGMLSPDFRCKTFDSTANGYVRAEGAFFALIESRQGDSILPGHLVLQAVLTNQDGRSAGLTAPNGAAQSELMKRALQLSAQNDIDFVEAHGTGTPLGDPIEINAVKRALKATSQPVMIGSSKTNFGHFETAAGFAGLFRLFLAARSGQMNRLLHFSLLNPEINLEESKLTLLLEETQFSRAHHFLLNSFGFTGTNATVITSFLSLPLYSENNLLARAISHTKNNLDKLVEMVRLGHILNVVEEKPSLQLPNSVSCVIPIQSTLSGADVAMTKKARGKNFEILLIGASVGERVRCFRAQERILRKITNSNQPSIGRVSRNGVLTEHGAYQISFMAREFLDELFVINHFGGCGPGLNGALKRNFADVSLHGSNPTIVPSMVIFVGRHEKSNRNIRCSSPTMINIFGSVRGERNLVEIDILLHSLSHLISFSTTCDVKLQHAPFFCFTEFQSRTRFQLNSFNLCGYSNTSQTQNRFEFHFLQDERYHVESSFLAFICDSIEGICEFSDLVLDCSSLNGTSYICRFTERSCKGLVACDSRVIFSCNFDASNVALQMPPPPEYCDIYPAVALSLAPAHLRDDIWMWNLSSRSNSVIGLFDDLFVSLLQTFGRHKTLTSIEKMRVSHQIHHISALVVILKKRNNIFFDCWLCTDKGLCLLFLNGLKHETILQQRETELVPSSIVDKTLGQDNDVKVSQLVSQAVTSVLGFSNFHEVDPDTPFLELGFDSILTIELSRKLEVLTGNSFSPTIIFANPTIRSLQSFLIRQFGEFSVPNRSERQQYKIFQPSPSNMSPQVAITGASVRLCDAFTTDDVWRLLDSGHQLSTVIPESRWDYAQFGGVCQWGVFLNDPFLFDNKFFSLSPRESSLMDPQQRMVLECSWEVIEDAGLDPSSLNGTTSSVFVGIQAAEYKYRVTVCEVSPRATSLACSVAAGRVSYFLGILGESVSVDTACSSSLVAISLGCKSIIVDKNDSSLCFGVNALFDPEMHASLSSAGMLSMDGRCKTFDLSANGYLRSEGCGAVFLQQNDIIDDGVQRVDILTCTANQDGRSNGLTAPNGAAQERLIAKSKAIASQRNKSRQSLVHMEAHGTGTSLGDPIEMQAILSANMQQRSPMIVSSSKTLYGHGECSAGVMGVIKTVLCFEKQTIPQHLNFWNLNPLIGLQIVEGLKCSIPLESIGLVDSMEMRASVSAFGMSGTNAFMIMSYAVKNPRKLSDLPPLIANISAKSEESLKRMCKMVRERIILGLEDARMLNSSSFLPSSTHFVTQSCRNRKIMAPMLQCLHVSNSLLASSKESFVTIGYVFDRSHHDCLKIEDVVFSEAASGSSVSHVNHNFASRLNIDNILRGLLGIPDNEEIDRSAPLFELGFDSMLNVELAKKLSMELGREILPTIVYSHPNAQSLENFINLVDDVQPSTVSSSLRSFPKNTRAYSKGIGCRIGDCMNPEQFSQSLLSHLDFVQVVPNSRFSWKSVYSTQNLEGKTTSKWGSFLHDIFSFDGEFFSITAQEAASMDPQQRVVLETSWEALESSNIDLNNLHGKKIGVYGGIEQGDFWEVSDDSGHFVSTGYSAAIAAGRVSYFLGITGTAITVNTACSSSLVALCLGVHALTSSSELGFLCFGVKAIFSPKMFVVLSQAMMLSPTGRCRGFDIQADGYVRAEACVSIFLDTDDTFNDSLSVLGFNTNQDGASNGLTAPSGRAQVELIKQALLQIRNGTTNPPVAICEAHGTGTPLGDPIEINSLSEVYGKHRAYRSSPLLVRSVKSNIGHAEHAAGVTGVLSLLLSARTRSFAKHLHLNCLNPFIGESAMYSSNFVVPAENVDLSDEELISCISSFGFSGTNCHIIFKALPNQRIPSVGNLEKSSPLNFTLSARSHQSIDFFSSRLRDWLIEIGDCNLLVNALATRKIYRQKIIVKSDSLRCKSIVQALPSAVQTNKSLLMTHSNYSLPTYFFERFVAGVIDFKAKKPQRTFGERVILSGSTYCHQLDRIAVANLYCVEDHVVFGTPVIPGAFHLSVIIEQARENHAWENFHLNQVSIRKPVFLSDVEGTNSSVEFLIQYHFQPHNELLVGQEHVQVRSLQGDGEWQVHLECNICFLDSAPPLQMSDRPNEFSKITPDIWGNLENIFYGESFRWLGEVIWTSKNCWFTLKAPVQWKYSLFSFIPPELMDSVFQSCLFAEPEKVSRNFMAPFAMEHLYVFKPFVPRQNALGMQRLISKSVKAVEMDIDVTQDSRVLCMSGVTLIQTESSIFLGETSRINQKNVDNLAYEVSWVQVDELLPNLSQEYLEVCVFSSNFNFVNFMRRFCAVHSQRASFSAKNASTRDEIVLKGDEKCIINAFMFDSANMNSFALSVDLFQKIAHCAFENEIQFFTVLRFSHRIHSLDPLIKVNAWARALWSCGRSFSLELSNRKRHIMVDVQNWTSLMDSENVFCGKWTGGAELVLREKKIFSAKLTRHRIKDQSEQRTGIGGKDRIWIVSGGSGALGTLFINKISAQHPSHAFFVISRNTSQGKFSAGFPSILISCQVDCTQVGKTQSSAVFCQIHVNLAVKTLLHLAGNLNDEMIVNSSWLTFRRTIRPKVAGILSLIRAFSGIAQIVMFSSATSLIGNVGQANYGAANGFLDALCYNSDIQAVSINWGPWDAGMYASMEKHLLPTLKQSEAYNLLNSVLMDESLHEIGIIRIDWNSSNALMFKSPLTSHLFPKQRNATSHFSREEVRMICSRALRSILHLGENEEIDEEMPFSDMGIDSSLSIDLRNTLNKELHLQLSVTLLFDHPSFKSLMQKIEETVFQTEETRKAEVEEAVSLQPVSFRSKRLVAQVQGSACRFGASRDLHSLWKSFEQEKDCVSLIPSERFLWQDYFGADRSGEMSVSKWGSFVEHFDEFDSAFFQISPKEARAMDPKNRVLLETAWECFESAGRNPSDPCEGDAFPAGVYVGIWPSEYLDNFEHHESSVQFLAVGTSPASACGRVSFFFGLKGQSVAIDTACSSSLVALSYGNGSITRGEESIALCFGTNSICSPKLYVVMSMAGMLSPDGRCKTFDKEANGYVRGEGCGVVLLAEESRSSGLERGSFLRVLSVGVNQDGRSQSLTAPNGPAQSRLLRDVLRSANVEADSITTLEAHGTGTSLGDPIEVQAVADVYKRYRRQNFIVSSAKTNYGHTETSAGILSLIKLALSIESRKLPVHLHLNLLNPYIGSQLMESSCFSIPLETIEWNLNFCAAVSSFGFAGTNAHALIDQRVLSHHGFVETNAVTRTIISAPNDFDLNILQEKANILRKELANWTLIRQHHRDVVVLSPSLPEIRSSRKKTSHPSYPLALHVSATSFRDTHLRGQIRSREFFLHVDCPEILHAAFAVPGQKTSKLGACVAAFFTFFSLRALGVTFDSVFGSKLLISVIDGQVRLDNALVQVDAEILGVSPSLIDSKTILCVRSGRTTQAKTLLGRQKVVFVEAFGTKRARLSQNSFQSCISFLSSLGHILHKPVQPNFREALCYPFSRRKSHWAGDPLTHHRGRVAKTSTNPFCPTPILNPFGQRNFQLSLSHASFSGLRDMIGLVHIGMWIEMYLSCLDESNASSTSRFDFEFVRPLFVESNDTCHIYFETRDSATSAFSSKSPLVHESWALNFHARIRSDTPELKYCLLDPTHISEKSLVQSYQEFYDMIAQSGVKMGPSVAWIDSVHIIDDLIVGIMKPWQVLSDTALSFHVGLLDACAQLFFVEERKTLHSAKLVMTTTLRNFHLSRVTKTTSKSYAILKRNPQARGEGYVQFVDSMLNIICSFECTIISFQPTVTLLDGPHRPLVNFSDLNRNDQFTFVRDSLIDAVADATGAEANTIHLDEPISSFGIDSMLALSLTTSLQVNYSWSIDPISIAQGASVMDLIKMIIATSSNDPKILAVHSFFETKHSDIMSKCIMYCFPFGGAGSQIFSQWQSLFDPNMLHIEPVCLPGRGTRSLEQSISEIDPLVDSLCKAIQIHSKGHAIAFYGHSLGGAIAFACASTLEKDFGISCAVLAIGGVSCPSTLRKNEILQEFYTTSGLTRVPDISEVGEDIYLGWMKRMGSVLPPVEHQQAYLRSFGSILNSDLRLAESFYSKNWDSLYVSCPLQVFCALNDPNVPMASMREWEKKTSGKFAFIEIDSQEHLFILSLENCEKISDQIFKEIK